MSKSVHMVSLSKTRIWYKIGRTKLVTDQVLHLVILPATFYICN